MLPVVNQTHVLFLIVGGHQRRTVDKPVSELDAFDSVDLFLPAHSALLLLCLIITLGMAAQGTRSHACRILFMHAMPAFTGHTSSKSRERIDPLALEGDIRCVTSAVMDQRRASIAVSPATMTQLVTAKPFTVLHIASHCRRRESGGYELILEDDCGHGIVVPADDLARTITTLGFEIDLVILACCHSAGLVPSLVVSSGKRDALAYQTNPDRPTNASSELCQCTYRAVHVPSSCHCGMALQ